MGGGGDVPLVLGTRGGSAARKGIGALAASSVLQWSGTATAASPPVLCGPPFPTIVTEKVEDVAGVTSEKSRCCEWQPLPPSLLQSPLLVGEERTEEKGEAE